MSSGIELVILFMPSHNSFRFERLDISSGNVPDMEFLSADKSSFWKISKRSANNGSKYHASANSIYSPRLLSTPIADEIVPLNLFP
jgi:hypothetical protein